MSYSIREGIADLKEKLEAETLIAELYPDAHLSTINEEQIWTSERVVPTDVDIFIAASDAIADLFKVKAVLLGYVNVKKMRVYQTTSHAVPLRAWSLKQDCPRAYDALVEFMKQQGEQ